MSFLLRSLLAAGSGVVLASACAEIADPNLTADVQVRVPSIVPPSIGMRRIEAGAPATALRYRERIA